MTRRKCLALLGLQGTLFHVTPTEARAGLHVRGTLHEDAPDQQPGYYVLCGVDGGPCQAKDAIAISVHPDNRTYMQSLREKVGRTVQLSIF